MNSFFYKSAIPFYVFITGACVLVIEIVAIRILAPYFGNTIFTVSSVLSVVLAALSLGYYVGGKTSDKYPDERFFYGIITISGFCVILLHLMSLIFLPIFGYKLSITQGPLISSILLFFFQSFLLGMLSPFAIKLQKERSENLGIGTVSGQIFFWSTLGSIFGSLSSGFFLIPNFSLDKIVIGVGFVLIALGLYGIFKAKIWQKISLSLLLAVCFLFFSKSLGLASSNTIFIKDSAYQKIIVYENVYNGKTTRFLQQDKNPSSAMYLESEELPYEYTKYYALYQLFNKKIKESLTIGGGAYSVPKTLLHELPEANIDVAEIDPLLFEVGKKYFNVPDADPRFNNFAEDGRRFLNDSKKQYDFIFSDAYSSFFSIPEHLTTQEFFKLTKNKLSENGVFIANVIGSLNENPESFLLSEIKTFKSVFENSYFFAVNSVDSTKIQNIIFVGWNSDKKIDFDGPEIIKNKNYIIANLKSKKIDLSKINLSTYPILTDNYAPVDYLISKEFTNFK